MVPSSLVALSSSSSSSSSSSQRHSHTRHQGGARRTTLKAQAAAAGHHHRSSYHSAVARLTSTPSSSKTIQQPFISTNKKVYRCKISAQQQQRSGLSPQEVRAVSTDVEAALDIATDDDDTFPASASASASKAASEDINNVVTLLDSPDACALVESCEVLTEEKPDTSSTTDESISTRTQTSSAVAAAATTFREGAMLEEVALSSWDESAEALSSWDETATATAQQALYATTDLFVNAFIVSCVAGTIVFAGAEFNSELHRGWTPLEILEHIPQNNWRIYETMLDTNPVGIKSFISGVVYGAGDWLAQAYERAQDASSAASSSPTANLDVDASSSSATAATSTSTTNPIAATSTPLESLVSALSFDRPRLLRSVAVGALLQAPIYHYYYEITEMMFPSEVQTNAIIKLVLDQTITIACWNALYYAFLGFLDGDEPRDIWKKITATAWPLMKSGWRLWPAAHIITYGVIPVQHRLLWVDMVEVLWVVILSLTGAAYGDKEEKTEDDQQLT